MNAKLKEHISDLEELAITQNSFKLHSLFVNTSVMVVLAVTNISSGLWWVSLFAKKSATDKNTRLIREKSVPNILKSDKLKQPTNSPYQLEGRRSGYNESRRKWTKRKSFEQWSGRHALVIYYSKASYTTVSDFFECYLCNRIFSNRINFVLISKLKFSHCVSNIKSNQVRFQKRA